VQPQRPQQVQQPFLPFTAFNNFPPAASRPQSQIDPNQNPGRATGLGFEAIRNTVVHDAGSQSSSFFSFQRPEFQRPQQTQQPQPVTRFPVAERPSPIQQQQQQPPPNFFGSFPSLGSFVDPRSGGGGQRAQRALPEGATVPLQEEVNRQLPNPSYRFPEPDFGGFVPMKKKNRRY
jgi:hypothetical protein